MTDRLFFYSNSADARPGRGAREAVACAAAYEGLAKVPHWRRVLSNFHVEPFVSDGRTFRTIEHAFQAAKIAIASREDAARFTVESGDAIGAGDGPVAQKNRKLRRLTPAQLAQWDAAKDGVMARAAECKYAQSALARDVLARTGGAELWHLVPRGAPVRFAHLEAIRAALV